MLTCKVDNSSYLQPGATITYTDGEGNSFCFFFAIFATDPLENLFLGTTWSTFCFSAGKVHFSACVKKLTIASTEFLVASYN